MCAFSVENAAVTAHRVSSNVITKHILNFCYLYFQMAGNAVYFLYY